MNNASGHPTVTRRNGSGPSGAATVACSRCGTEADEGRNHCEACGCFLPSSSVRLEHGARRLASGRGTPLDRARMSEIEAAVVQDLGGDDQISGVMSALIVDFAFAVVLRDLLSAHLQATGPLTRAGKKKAAYTTWLQASARVEALARRIGTDRRPAKLPTLEEYIAAKERQEGAGPGARPASDPAGSGTVRERVENRRFRPRAAGPVPLPGLDGIDETELHPDEVAP